MTATTQNKIGKKLFTLWEKNHPKNIHFSADISTKKNLVKIKSSVIVSCKTLVSV